MNAIMACIGGRAPPGQKKRSPYAGSRWPNGARGSPPPGAGAWRPCPWSGQACARCLARPCQPIDAASAPCSRSSRQSKSPSPTARNDPSRARKPAEPQACALPAKIGSVSCLPSLHFLKVRSLRQTRSGSAFPADAYLAPAQRAVWHARLTGVVVRLANNKPPQYFCPRQAIEIKGVCAELESAQLRHPKRRSATSTIRRLQALPPIVTFYAIRLKRAAPVKGIGLET